MKIDQLLTLFACECREGRPEAAPLLRREGVQTQFEINDSNEDALKVLEDAKMHDPSVLPHHYDDAEMNRIFPSIEAPPQDEFGERELPGGDASLEDPIDEPYVIRVHRPHTLTTKAGSADPTTTTGRIIGLSTAKQS